MKKKTQEEIVSGQKAYVPRKVARLVKEGWVVVKKNELGDGPLVIKLHREIDSIF